jgi:hypothetical protein
MMISKKGLLTEFVGVLSLVLFVCLYQLLVNLIIELLAVSVH